MSYKIISDSSSNIFSTEEFNYESVPMKIVAGDREFLDTPQLDVRDMVLYLKSYKGKSGSSCPNIQEWIDAFGDADNIYGITISGNLSGSYNAASQALSDYLENHPEKKGVIFDSYSAGPEQAMIAEKIGQLVGEGLDFDTVKEKLIEYDNHVHLLFCLESLNNLARNGRVSPAVAKIASVLGIRMLGEACDGQISPIDKPRGEKKALKAILQAMLERGLHDGALVRIAHCFNETTALALKENILELFPNCRIIVEPTAALCSFYAEHGGLMIGFEGSFNKKNRIKL